MIPEKVCIKFTEEIINEFRLPRTTCYSFIKLRMERVYGAGYDKGLHSSNSRKPPCPIIQLTTDGQVIKLWPSIRIAAKALGINDPSSITKCAKGNDGNSKLCGGFKWKYGNSPKPEFKLF